MLRATSLVVSLAIGGLASGQIIRLSFWMLVLKAQRAPFTKGKHASIAATSSSRLQDVALAISTPPLCLLSGTACLAATWELGQAPDTNRTNKENQVGRQE